MTLKSKGDLDCPVFNLLRFLSVRGNKPGSLFCHMSGRPFTRTEFSKMLVSIQKFLKFPGLITPHGFRVGATTSAAAKGYSDQYICQLGRWDSTSFKNYIKLNSILV